MEPFNNKIVMIPVESTVGNTSLLEWFRGHPVIPIRIGCFSLIISNLRYRTPNLQQYKCQEF